MDSDDDNAEYRFKWAMTAEAEFFYSGSDSIYCILSQASIRDGELIRIAEVENELEKVTDSVQKLAVKSKLESDVEEMGDNLPFEQGEVVSGDCEKIELDPLYMGLNGDMTWENLRQINSQMPSLVEEKSRSKKRLEIDFVAEGAGVKRRKLTSNDCFPWMVGLDFEQYWKSAGQYLINASWVASYGANMDEGTWLDFQEQTLKLKPKNLLPSHRSLSGYKNIVSKKKRSFQAESWESLYKEHFNLVRKKAEHDFNKFKKRSSLDRCRNFIERAKLCGFVPGVEVADFLRKKSSSSLSGCGIVDSNAEEESSLTEDEEINSFDENNSVENSSNGPERKRLIVNYKGLELFDDVYADFYGPPLCLVRHSKNAFKNTVGSSEVASYMSSNQDQCMSATAVPSEDIINFDFGFDEKRDAYLVAKNACATYSNDKEMRKYWFQRYRLFSKLNDGILMDREGWFSVTPERIAQNIADRVVLKKDAIVVDAFAGVGGNSIQMALKGAYVIAIDLDPVRIRCAVQNARVYGVQNRINFLCSDFFHFAKKFANDEKVDEKNGIFDAVFLSPPWGGPSYLNTEVFDLNSGLSPNGFEIFSAARKLSPNIAYFLPRQTSIKQLISLAGKGGSCEIEHSLLNKKVKSITAYYGNLVAK